MTTSEFIKEKIKGTVLFANLATPRKYDNSTQTFVEDEEKGSYTLNLVVDAKELDKLNVYWKQFYKDFQTSKEYEKSSSKGYKDIFPQDYFTKDEEDHTKFIIKLKRNAVNSNGNKARPEVTDSFTNPLPVDLVKQIGSGTVARAIFTINPWSIEKTDDKTKDKYLSFGITFCLLGVQILELTKKSSIMGCITDEEKKEGSFSIEGIVDFAEEELIGEDKIPF